MSVGRAEPAAWHRGTSRDRPRPGPLTDEAGGAGGVDAVAAVGAVAVGDFIVRVGGRGAHVRVLELPLEAAARDRIHLAAARMERGRAAGGGGTCHRLPSASPSCRRARHGPVGTGKESQHPGTEPHPDPFLPHQSTPSPGRVTVPSPTALLSGVRSCGALAALVDKQSDTWGAPKLPPNRQESCETPGTRLRGPESC